MNKIQKKQVKKRSAFSMVELLFVMTVMAALAAIAIPELQGSGNAALVTGMKSDARNFINTVQGEIVLNDGTIPTFPTDGLENGDTYGSGKVKITKNNTITMTDETATCTNGYSISVANSEYTDKTAVFNSCTDSAPKVQ